MKWDSEVVTEGTTHCPGWRGVRLEVPEDMRNPMWPRMEDHAPPSTPPHQPIDSVAFGPNPSGSRGQRMERCQYFPCLWSPVVGFAGSGLRKPIGTCSSLASPIDFSDYATGSEHNFTTGSDLSGRDYPSTPPSARKRLRTEDLTRPNNSSRGNKRTRRSKSLESFADCQGNQTSWVTRRIERLGPLSPEPDLSTFSDLPPSPGKTSTGSTRSSIDSSHSRMSALTDPCPTRRAPATVLPRRTYPRQKSERGCSVLVIESGEEERVWFLSREALLDVKGYLQVKKVTGAAIEMPSGWTEGSVQRSHLRVERALRPSSTRLTSKRVGTPEDDCEEAQKPKRRRSWPEIDPYASKPNRASLLYNT
jgi:hypothetical protein